MGINSLSDLLEMFEHIPECLRMRRGPAGHLRKESLVPQTADAVLQCNLNVQPFRL